MSRRTIFCEGPDDLAALREIATRLLGATVLHGMPTGGASLERIAQLQLEEGTVEVKAGGGKSELARRGALYLETLPPVPDIVQVSLLFDPDDEPVERFFASVPRAIHEHAPSWTLVDAPERAGCWRATRQEGESIVVAAVAWWGDVEVLDGLSDAQSLERVILSVARRALSEEELAFLVRVLEGIHALPGRRPTWKAAVHVLCALTDAKTPGHAMAQRFLGQNKSFRPHVEGTLGETQGSGGAVLRDELAFMFTGHDPRSATP